MDKNAVIIAAAVFLITVSLLVLATTPRKGPVYKPYWMTINITALAEQGQEVGVVVYKGSTGWAIFGYQDNVTSPQRAQLLSVLNKLIAEAERYNYTVVIAPWGADNKTNEVLSALYQGIITPQQYLQGYVNVSAPINSSRISAASNYALKLAQTLGSYTAYPGYNLTPTTPPIIYEYLVVRGCLYPVYEPFEPYRDANYSDWAFWAGNAIANLPGLVGQPGCTW
ncbi:MAG: hypothetical protein TU35_000825 [Thermoproteus sp. AZ2]|jgi:hypothetical protein|uniref:Uncharacterized protein n=1 Tax=Thermoproteus sp. AZ2 TaxID=1609232 RepID=A0ACC6UYK5_9CREN|nr:MAG: hypothetical protein TU35_04905 [Thermoproteus sp. AZ2]